jgi:hypothetical protein
MTDRERTVRALTFGAPDRVPLEPGSGRKSTREAWYSQGLDREVRPEDIPEHAYRAVGGKLPWPRRPLGAKPFWVQQKMIPEFEERVIERRERSQIVQDWKGNVCEISNEFTTEYLRNAIDFVTRRWVKCPVESRADWEDMRRRYDPDDPARLPSVLQPADPELASRDWFVELSFNGPFWQLREWLGFEGLCTMFVDDPDFVREMISFWERYVLRLLDRAFRYAIPDCVHISEDMAYKSFSMISPTMVREFLLPTWTRWGEALRAAGVPLYAVDSDGFIGELIPIWMEAGVRCCDPIEVAAGNDINEFRRSFGRRMSYRGGVDKRAMAKGGRALEEELRRIEPVIRGGGYIPSCDHGIPADVSWPNFLQYLRRLAELCGWM